MLLNSSHKRTSALVTLLFALIILIPSLWGFSGKFSEFIKLYRGEVDGVFAISPIVNYLLASLGFFCLFGWAVLHGMFSDIEKPKESMLETEEELDRLLKNGPLAPQGDRTCRSENVGKAATLLTGVKLSSVPLAGASGLLSHKTVP